MDLTIDLITQITNAIDKAIGSLQKLGTMFYDAGSTTVVVLEKGLAKKTHRQLRDLCTRTTYLVQSLCPRMLHSMEKYLNVRDDQQWDEFQKEVRNTMVAVRALSDDLLANSKAITTTDFFPVLVDAVSQRELALENFSTMTPPTTPEEIDAVRILVKKYAELLDVLSDARTELGKYIEAQEAKKT